jgi:hypothetical protein
MINEYRTIGGNRTAFCTETEAEPELLRACAVVNLTLFPDPQAPKQCLRPPQTSLMVRCLHYKLTRFRRMQSSGMWRRVDLV